MKKGLHYAGKSEIKRNNLSNKRISSIKLPSAEVGILFLHYSYSSLNSRISAIEKEQAELDAAYIQTTLAQIQTHHAVGGIMIPKHLFSHLDFLDVGTLIVNGYMVI